MNEFEHIKQQYESSYRTHGDSPASLLCPKGLQNLRFRAIDPFVARTGVRVLDYGCGLGHLLNYLDGQGRSVEYRGMDMVPSFIAACEAKYAHRAKFSLVSAEQAISGPFDVVFLSGVFNLRTGDADASKAYAFAKLEQLFEVAEEVLICDFLSGFVDFEQPDAQHFSISEVAQFVVKQLTRRFTIRHDLRPYEFTLIAYKDDEITRPENVFSADVSA